MAVSRVAVLGALFVGSRLRIQPFRLIYRAWDGGFYVDIAQHGYPRHVTGQSRIAFFPMYPLLLSAVHFVTRIDWTMLTWAVSFALSLLAAALLWRAVRDWQGKDAADRAVVLFAFFPGSFVLTMAYSEGVLLCAALACLLWLSKRNWVAAGLAGAVCSAARPNGIVIVACCAWAALVAIRERGEWRALIAPVLAPLGALAYFVFLWRHTGHADAWFDVEKHGWRDRTKLLAFVDRVTYLARHPGSDLQGWLVVGLTLAAVVLVAFLLRDQVPGTWLIWTLGTLFLSATSVKLGVRPRFFLTAFPLFVPLAVRLRDEAYAVTAAVFAVALSAVTIMTVTSLLLVP
jgi:hypothetical protein